MPMKEVIYMMKNVLLNLYYHWYWMAIFISKEYSFILYLLTLILLFILNFIGSNPFIITLILISFGLFLWFKLEFTCSITFWLICLFLVYLLTLAYRWMDYWFLKIWFHLIIIYLKIKKSLFYLMNLFYTKNLF